MFVFISYIVNIMADGDQFINNHGTDLFCKHFPVV